MVRIVEIIEINGQTVIQSEHALSGSEIGALKNLWNETAAQQTPTPIFISGIYIVDKRSNTPTN